MKNKEKKLAIVRADKQPTAKDVNYLCKMFKNTEFKPILATADKVRITKQGHLIIG